MKDSEKESITPNSNQEIFEAAISAALEIAKRDQLKLGTTVCIAGEEPSYSYSLKEINGDMALIEDEDDELEKSVPLNSLYEPNVAWNIANKIHSQAISMTKPEKLE